MTSADSLRKHGTITLGIDYMRLLIRIDRARGSVDLADWIAFIPEVYRDQVIAIVEPVLFEFLGDKLTGDTLECLIQAMHAAICAASERFELLAQQASLGA